MNLLLDTNAFMWWANGNPKLSFVAREACADKSNTLHLSVVSAWEMQIKMQLGKLQMPEPLHVTIQAHILQSDLRILSVSLDHIYALEELPHHHRDPFDRLRDEQAVHENMSLVSGDALLKNYPVSLIW